MKIINTATLPEETWTGSDGHSTIAGKEVSEALGRIPGSTDENDGHPFDVEIQRIPPGVQATYYHHHSKQWEFYHVLAGSGTVRYADGSDAIAAGDAFIFKPGEAHQITAGTVELVMYVIANNPAGDQGKVLE